jgi:hypothetical protein
MLNAQLDHDGVHCKAAIALSTQPLVADATTGRPPIHACFMTSAQHCQNLWANACPSNQHPALKQEQRTLVNTHDPPSCFPLPRRQADQQNTETLTHRPNIVLPEGFEPTQTKPNHALLNAVSTQCTAQLLHITMHAPLTAWLSTASKFGLTKPPRRRPTQQTKQAHPLWHRTTMIDQRV